MKILKYLIASVFLFLYIIDTYAQPGLPERTAQISSTQSLNFGDITIKPGSSGGKAIVGFDGRPDYLGDVILLEMYTTRQQAIFEFKLCPGRTVTLMYSLTVVLTGSNGGSMTLNVGPTNLGISGSQFTSNLGCDDLHKIKVGGTLEVGPLSANPPGLYTGSFSLTLIQQ